MAAPRLRQTSIGHTIWISSLLAVTFVLGLVVANAGARDCHADSGASTSVAVPDSPPSQSLQSPVRQELCRMLAGYVLAENDGLSMWAANPSQICPDGATHHPVRWRKLCPLYRRPPPISS